MTGTAATLAVPGKGTVSVGLDELDWNAIDWQKEEDRVRRLRQEIFAASKAGDLRRLRDLQEVMLRSRANALTSTRRVTQHSSGRFTAGLDGRVALDPKARAALAQSVLRDMKASRSVKAKAKPVKRVYIPKSNGKQRPLGIPVIRDRVLQAIVKNALEPEWEARFEMRSYGFRPGRSGHDAIEAIFQTVAPKGATRGWVLDADLSAAFDKIDHEFLLNALGTFPARGMVKEWLKAGVVEKGVLARTEEGTPQGGVISPLLLNVALHGLEQAAGVSYHNAIQTGKNAGMVSVRKNSPVLVRYADDFVVLAATKKEAEAAKIRIAKWLQPRGLAINEDKTRVVPLTDGFDFLGFNVRRYRNGSVYIKPSDAALKRMRERLSTEVKALRGQNAAAVIKRLNPIIRGWSAYYRGNVSTEAFNSLDSHLHRLLWLWAVRGHANRPRTWVRHHYFGQFVEDRQDKWVFGDRRKTSKSGRVPHLTKFSWTKIVRHAAVQGFSSPDDPDPKQVQYWQDRQSRKRLPLSPSREKLAVKQGNKCPLCTLDLLDVSDTPQTPREIELWLNSARKALHAHHFLVYRRHGGSDEYTNFRLVHAECHRQHHSTHPVGAGCEG